MKQISIATLSLALLFGATACGASTGGTPTTESAKAQEASESPAVTPTPEAVPEAVTPTTEPTPEGTTGTAKMGTVWKYDDGLTLSASFAGNAVASETAAGAEKTQGAIQMYDVVLTNGTKKIFDPATVYITANYGADGVAADRVFDSANQIGDSFQGKILPGKKQTVRIAFAMPPSAKDIIVSIVPDFNHTDALFVK